MLIFEAQLLDQQLLTDTSNQMHKVILLSNKKVNLSRNPLDLAPGVFATIVFVSVAPGQVNITSASGPIKNPLT